MKYTVQDRLEDNSSNQNITLWRLESQAELWDWTDTRAQDEAAG